MTKKEIKKERNATTALLVCTIFAIVMNILSLVLNLISTITEFNPLSLAFTLLSVLCIVGLSCFIPDNLETIRECNRRLGLNDMSKNK